MSTRFACAPGWPGSPARWTSSAKTGLGTALARQSRLWFTVSHGILNEIYYPRVDQACTRDMGLIVTDGREFFSEEKRHTRQDIASLAEGVPAYRLTNSCVQGRYRIEKEIVTDPSRAVLLQRIRFVALQGASSNYRLHVLLAPHLANHGGGNTAWIGAHEGQPMLFAERDGCALALACSAGWVDRSVGFVGVSDGWQDLRAHKKMSWNYERARNGNVALTGEILVPDDSGAFVLALGFGSNAAEAASLAAASLVAGFDRARDEYVREWQSWQASLRPIESPVGQPHLLDAVSAAVIRTCESKAHPGGIVASLSLPWGFAKGDNDLGGYHLVWPRDLVETAGGLLAVGAMDDARRVLRYLQDTQLEDGHWSQNMWIDGTPYWGGVQLDETAFPILLVDMARRQQALDADQRQALWPMVRRAVVYLLVNGPVALQDRWEEDPGYSPFTLAATNRGPAGSSRPRRRGRRLGSCRLCARHGRLLERCDRTLDVHHRHGPRAAVRGGRLLRPHRAARVRRRGISDRRVRAHQEPSARPERGARLADHQSRCPRAGPLRAARARRSSHRAHGGRDRCPAEDRHPEGARLASLQRRWVR